MKTLSILTILVLGVIGNAFAQVPTGELTNGLVSFYPFNGNFDDVIGGNNLINYGATFTSNQYQKPSNAISVTPTAHLVSEKNVGISGNQARTVSLWVNVQTNPIFPNGRLVTWGNNDPSQGFWFYYADPHGYSGDAATEFFTLAADYAYQAQRIKPSPDLVGRWHHVVYTYFESMYDTKFYVDGVAFSADEMVSYVGSYSINTYDSPLYLNGDIPQNSGQLGISGAISAVGIWNRALTAAEVLALYNSQRPVYEVTLTTKSSTNLNEWTGILTNKIETYNPTEFYKNDISVTIKPPAP
jgi:Concanavalin A-like lectin/glucanases superfamily